MTNAKSTVLSALAGLLATGCAALPGSSSDNNVSFDITRGTVARIVNAESARESVETVIRGEVAFPNSVKNGFFTGTVNGTIEIPGSKPLMVSGIKVHGERRPKLTGKHGYFTVHTRQILPSGSVAHLTYSDR